MAAAVKLIFNCFKFQTQSFLNPFMLFVYAFILKDSTLQLKSEAASSSGLIFNSSMNVLEVNLTGTIANNQHGAGSMVPFVKRRERCCVFLEKTGFLFLQGKHILQGFVAIPKNGKID